MIFSSWYRYFSIEIGKQCPTLMEAARIISTLGPKSQQCGQISALGPLALASVAHTRSHLSATLSLFLLKRNLVEHKLADWDIVCSILSIGVVLESLVCTLQVSRNVANLRHSELFVLTWLIGSMWWSDSLDWRFSEYPSCDIRVLRALRTKSGYRWAPGNQVPISWNFASLTNLMCCGGFVLLPDSYWRF